MLISIKDSTFLSYQTITISYFSLLPLDMFARFITVLYSGSLRWQLAALWRSRRTRVPSFTPQGLVRPILYRIPSTLFGSSRVSDSMQGLLEGVPAMEMGSSSVGVSGASSGSSDSLHGLKFGKKIYFEDGGGNSSKDALAPASVAAPPPPPTKKMRGVVKGGLQQPPRCQVDGCKVDLTGAKTYYCKHKVCGMHSKAPKVTVAGLEQRFCQQCSRFVLIQAITFPF